MMEDRYGLVATSSHPEARAAFEEAVFGLAAHRPETGAALGRTLAADPDHIPALALKGFANLILARAELVAPAATALADARAALDLAGGGTADERVLVDALAAAVAGRFSAAAVILDRGFADRPTAFLPFKLSHAMRFMLGDAAGMRRAGQRMLADWSPDLPAAGFLIGCQAFAEEECGDLGVAERLGREAVRLEPADAWGLHAVSHVYEMRGEVEAGIDWLETSRPAWSNCNNFAFHMAWHLGLLHLERGDGEAVLDIYDRQIRPTPTDDFRDMANAVSMLWRVERRGFSVGRRWQDLAEIARRRRQDTTLVFASLHTLVALTALGERTAAAELLAAIERLAGEDSDQGDVAADVGRDLARIITGIGGRSRGRQECELLMKRLPAIGGSHAQRDLFVLALAEAAARSGDAAQLSRIRAARSRLRREDHLIGAIVDGTSPVACLA